MDYILIPAFVIGLLLFLYGWLRVVLAGFRHHPTTGMLASIPIVNILVLPTIWHKVSTSVIAGFVGLVLAISTWFLGADQRLYRYSNEMGDKLIESEQPPTTSTMTNLAVPNTTTPKPTHQTPATIAGTIELPRNALYRMVYKTIDISTLDQHKSNYIRITRQDRSRIEGKLLDLEDSYLVLERRADTGMTEQKVILKDITQVEVMVRE